MAVGRPLRVLIISPQCDGQGVGETWNAYSWVSRLVPSCDVTLLTSTIPKRFRGPGRKPPSEQLPQIRVVEWESFPYLPRFRKMASMIKPDYFSFYFSVRRWIRRALANGEQFDLAHQLTPLAFRYPSPLKGLGIPYIIGPLAGGLPTPPRFANECRSAPLYTRLRAIDEIRLRHDPFLRKTYSSAEVVLCSTPYVRDALSSVPTKRCEVLCEVGVDHLAASRLARRRQLGELRMLHVGRLVRTKGLRDAIRAMARLADLPNVTLDVAGDGEELEPCRREVEELGLSSRIRFWGRLTRDEVEERYKEADLFLFPSFREATGIVLFEAMRNGLPIITTDRGGPGYIVNESCGVRVPVEHPSQFADDLAVAIRDVAVKPGRLEALSEGARARTQEIGLWPNKIKVMLKLYREVSEGQKRVAAAT